MPRKTILKLLIGFKKFKEKYFEGENKQVLYASKELWEHMTADLIKLGFIKTFDFNKTVNYKFIEQK